jgi:hypothetical protein
MTERLVDVMDARRLVIHTFPITIEGLEIPDSRYERKALEAAAYEKLVPDAELHSLTARMHTSRRGPLEPLEMIETFSPKRRRASTRAFGTAPTFFGSRRVAPKGRLTNIGIVRVDCIFRNAPTPCGNKRAARTDAPMNTWSEPAILRGLAR